MKINKKRKTKKKKKWNAKMKDVHKGVNIKETEKVIKKIENNDHWGGTYKMEKRVICKKERKRENLMLIKRMRIYESTNMCKNKNESI